MYSCIKTCTLQGLNGFAIDVEVDLTNGLPKVSLVGLPDTAIKESVERVRSAIKNSGYEFPRKRITINLAPANLKKDGTQMDLAIAVALICAQGMVDKSPDDYIFLGELALDGQINEISGALPMVISMREAGFRKFMVPYGNRKECSVISDVEIYPVHTFEEVIEFLTGQRQLERVTEHVDYSKVTYDLDFSDIKGQHGLKRMMEIAASMKANMLCVGVPGSGKTMAAKRFPTILPPLTFEEAIEVTKIYSVSGLLHNHALITTAPFRSPHHTASAAALIGGGQIPKPGEISLSHKGVLFLDELPEFSKHVLEVLRQPLESKEIQIARANASLTYPADFLLIGAMNPCPCGYSGSKKRQCTCNPYQIHRYLSKISHPLLDRIDLHLEISEVEYQEISATIPEESSENIRARVELARNIQSDRFKDEDFRFNSEIPDKLLHKFIPLDSKVQKIMEMSYHRYQMSARTYNKILKIARTIADLDGSEKVREDHILESLQYRSVDGKYWGR
ncbi:MAG: YifB family Mg chelatase-like AAA ATPase [Tissierellia bacterium]|nr:YifB family Mg chelatase-like AAA ATPase [Tissierellia bacterium]